MKPKTVWLFLDFPVIWKEQVVLVVGAASSRDHLISRLEAAPTGGFMVTWTFRINAFIYLDTAGSIFLMISGLE